MRSNIAISAALLALAGYVFIAARQLPFGSFRVPQTAFFPTTLAVLLAILSLVQLAQPLDESQAARGPGRIEADGWVRIGATLATLAGFAVALEWLGFLVSTFLLMVLLLRAIEAQKWHKVIAVALATTLISYGIFSWLLGIMLPVGVLGI